jgi:S1-C subfamily serine protease
MRKVALRNPAVASHTYRGSVSSGQLSAIPSVIAVRLENSSSVKELEMESCFERKLLCLLFLTTGVAAAQSVPPHKDIPAIAKAANGAVVTVVMASNDTPIARGTGFLVSPDGEILTNYHVIQIGNVAVVKFPDGTVLPVEGVLAADKVRDLAIIKIHGKHFSALTLGNSDRVQIGEEVVAIGTPLGLELTVSNGILSGVRTDEKEGGKFLQVTAPISHGSSGGPLFNMAGEVIGITSMYFEGGENLNFAIPVNDAKFLLRNQFIALHALPNEMPTKTPVAKKTVPDTPAATTKGLRFSDEFVRAAIIAINSLDTPRLTVSSLPGAKKILERRDALLHDLQNIADLEKEKRLRDYEGLVSFEIHQVFISFEDALNAFLDRTKQIMASRAISIDDAMDLAAAEPEYKAVAQQSIGCANALKERIHDGDLDEPDACIDLRPITAYRKSVICHISQDDCDQHQQ